MKKPGYNWKKNAVNLYADAKVESHDISCDGADLTGTADSDSGVKPICVETTLELNADKLVEDMDNIDITKNPDIICTEIQANGNAEADDKSDESDGKSKFVETMPESNTLQPEGVKHKIVITNNPDKIDYEIEANGDSEADDNGDNEPDCKNECLDIAPEFNPEQPLEVENEIDVTKNPDKVYYISRCDGSLFAAKLLGKRTAAGLDKSFEYYVHYLGVNRRLDGWVARYFISDQVDDLGGLTAAKISYAGIKLSQAMLTSEELANGKSYYMSTCEVQNQDINERKMTRYQKRRYDEINHVQKSDLGLTAAQAALEKEHEEITKIKYIDKLQLGKYQIETWYFSPFPGEYGKVGTIYVCEFCLKYMRLRNTYAHHLSTCERRRPPGRKIYRKGTICMYEINGSAEPLYCQLLCLVAKLFLDHKVLYFDMAPFFFYVLCEIDEDGCHIVGYFSKEKESSVNNVACILVLPPYQRKGYGKFLISFSYELSRREGVFGSPEKPLSDLGRLSYRGYWAYTLLNLMKETRSSTQSIKMLSEQSGFTQEDVIYTLQSMKMIKYWRGQHVICITAKAIKEQLELPQFKPPKMLIDPEFLEWTPHPKLMTP